MKKRTTGIQDSSSSLWDGLEEWTRSRVQEWIQDLLEEEVTELLGRRKSERRHPVDTQGYRNGHGKPRRLTMSCGTITVSRPRVRNLEERFESRVLPLFKRRTEQVSELIPELYLHGLAQGDFDLALRGLLGEKAPLSASTVSRLKEKWQGEYEQWKGRSLADLEPVYLWVDGIYVKAGLEKNKAALLVAVAALSDGRKVVVAIEPGYRESEQSWSAFLRDLRRRGFACPRLVIGDGHLGIWAAMRNVYPEVDEQRCWNHRILNILAKIPKRHQAQGRLLLRAIPYAETASEATRLKRAFQKWCRERDLGDAAKLIDVDWGRMITFYRYPKEHWIHLRTSNVIESPFAGLRLRTDAAKRFKKTENATAIIFKLLLVAESRFRRLNAPELMRDVQLRIRFKDGIRVTKNDDQEAAA
jgi:transposase-like protein